MSRCALVLTTLASFLALGTVAHAQRADEPDVAELTRRALAQAAAGPTVDLTLEDAVKRALERNLDIAVEQLNPRTYDFTIQSLMAAYRPSVTSAFANGNRVSLPNSQLTGVTDKLNTGTVNWQAGLSQRVMWGGGSFSVNFNNLRTDSSNVFSTRNPSYSTSLQASYTQPLLRNFKIDATRTALQTSRISQAISQLALQGLIATTVAGARTAYWDLVYAVQAVEVARQSLALASKLVSDNRQRVEIGTMAPIDVVQAQAEEATRRQTLVQAESTLRTAELTLKRLIVNGTDDELWSVTINPVDRPTFSQEPIDLEGAVRHALDSRLDLQQARRQLESNDISLRSLRNQTLPTLDLTASYSLAGLGGTQFVRSGLGGSISQVFPGGYVDALKNVANFEAPTWNLQLNFSYPLGTSAADSSLARARLQLQQTQAQIKQLELQVATEVTNIALQLRSNLERVEAATAARELAQDRLDAEQSKFEVGLSTNFQVVQAQRDLADAQNTELRAVLDYRKSIVDFERVQLTGTARAVTSISGGGGGS